MKINLVVFSYSRFSGLVQIIEMALKHQEVISRILVISNGELPHSSWVEKFDKNLEIIFIGKRGRFDDSVLLMYDIAKNWDGYTYMCGDDDLPNLPFISACVNYCPNSLVIACNPPALSAPALRRIPESELFQELNKVMNKPVGYVEMLEFFMFSLPLCSFVLGAEVFQLVDRNYILSTLGTWHSYSLIAFEAVYKKWCAEINSRPFISINSDTNQRFVLPSTQIWHKDYAIDDEMIISLNRSFDLLNTSYMDQQGFDYFKKCFQDVINGWKTPADLRVGAA